MSYHIVYVNDDDPDHPTDGDQLATGLGWMNWGTHVLDRENEYPAAAHLAQEGWIDLVDDLEHEAERLTHAPDPNVAAVSAHLLAAVKARPAGTTAVIVTDGSEPDPDDEDDD